MASFLPILIFTHFWLFSHIFLPYVLWNHWIEIHTQRISFKTTLIFFSFYKNYSLHINFKISSLHFGYVEFYFAICQKHYIILSKEFEIIPNIVCLFLELIMNFKNIFMITHGAFSLTHIFNLSRKSNANCPPKKLN